MNGLIKQIFNDEIIFIISAFLTFLSGLISVLIRKQKNKPLKINIELNASEGDLYHDCRLIDIKEILRSQESFAKWYSIADGLLIFGQYIIGGLLASTLIQESLTTKLVGALGILVLISSLVRQRYRPDIKANISKRNVLELKNLTRSVEDDIFTINNYPDKAPSVIEIRKKVTKFLNEIEKNDYISSTKNIEKNKSIKADK